MKIKRKVQKTLPQLIEWAYREGSDVIDEKFKSESMTVTFSEIGTPYIKGKFHFLQADEFFTVTIEEEITEDTEFKELICLDVDDKYNSYDNVCILDFDDDRVRAIYIPNNDLTMTLIWRDGKLVE